MTLAWILGNTSRHWTALCGAAAIALGAAACGQGFSSGGADNGGNGGNASNNGGNGSSMGSNNNGNASCEPGDKESCWEAADGEAFDVDQPDPLQGNCRLGERTCESEGTWGPCLGAVAPAELDTCNPGDDSNCNGVANEECPCTGEETRTCGSDVGNCEKGMQTCIDGSWSACVGQVTAEATDGCADGDDANCNGTPNENGSCIDGEERACGSDTGSCELGIQTCVDGALGPCEGGVAAKVMDSCDDGNDDNCNGIPNEDCSCEPGTTQTCGTDTGPCSKGEQECGSDGRWGACAGGVQPKEADSCAEPDNDDNCNGVANDSCQCVGEHTEPCNGCGTRSCDTDTGQWTACKGVAGALTCQEGTRYLCGANGAWIPDPNGCGPGRVCVGEDAQCLIVDGMPCQANGDCATGTCGTFLRDADGDGYAPNDTMHMVCGTAPPGYVTPSSNRGLDCCDMDAATHPGATFQAEASNCGGFDHDCNDEISLEDERIATCSYSNGSCLSIGTPMGWVVVDAEKAPACGVTAPFQTSCTADLQALSCRQETEMRTQRCR